jgi:hypothetical protein
MDHSPEISKLKRAVQILSLHEEGTETLFADLIANMLIAQDLIQEVIEDLSTK